MVRVISLLLALAVPAVAWLIAEGGWGLGVLETLAAVILIVGFAVVAAGWTIQSDV